MRFRWPVLLCSLAALFAADASDSQREYQLQAASICSAAEVPSDRITSRLPSSGHNGASVAGERAITSHKRLIDPSSRASAFIRVQSLVPPCVDYFLFLMARVVLRIDIVEL
jgi:hypothetical protein